MEVNNFTTFVASKPNLNQNPKLKTYPNMASISDDVTMVWRLILPILKVYIEPIDILHLMSTSKAFIMEHYTDYPENLLYNVHRWFYELFSPVTPENRLQEFFRPSVFERYNISLIIDEFKWFVWRLYDTDKRYLHPYWRLVQPPNYQNIEGYSKVLLGIFRERRKNLSESTESPKLRND